MTSPSDPTAPYALPHFGVVKLIGVDAAGFGHSQFANDVKGLALGAWNWNACLTIQGRVSALFLTLRAADDQLLLVMPASERAGLVSQLLRYRLRSKIAITASDALRVGGACVERAAADADLAGPIADGGVARASAAGWTIALGGAASRRLMIVPEDVPLRADNPGVHAWRRGDLIDAVPWIAAATRDRFTAHALGIEALGAISTRKGCYPGQEIVARTHFLGRNKRTLMRFESIGATCASPPEPGSTLLDIADTTTAAEVIDALSSGSSLLGLAVARDAAVTRARLSDASDAPLTLVPARRSGSAP